MGNTIKKKAIFGIPEPQKLFTRQLPFRSVYTAGDVIEEVARIKAKYPDADADNIIIDSGYESAHLILEVKEANPDYEQQYAEWLEKKEEFEGKVSEEEKIRRQIKKLEKQLEDIKAK